VLEYSGAVMVQVFIVGTADAANVQCFTRPDPTTPD
jgi:hypothetical protein